MSGMRLAGVVKSRMYFPAPPQNIPRNQVMSHWTTELGFLVDPALLKPAQLSLLGIENDTLTIEHGDLTLIYALRVSSFAVVVGVTAILFDRQPMRRKEARVAYNVEADAVFRKFWHAAQDEIHRRRSESQDSGISSAMKAVQETVKQLKATPTGG